MKHISLFFLLIFMSVTAFAQEIDIPARDVYLKINDKKGRPVSSIIVKTVHASAVQAGITDGEGLFLFRNMTDKDSIAVTLPKYGETIIPVAGMDSIVVKLNSARLYSLMNKEGRYIKIQKERMEASTLLDVPALIEKHQYRSLSELLKGNVAGLNIDNNSTTNQTSANVRGQVSFHMSTEPLVVLNGFAYGTIQEADAGINIRDIKTIEVLKSAMEWGVRGSSGVILIKTK